MIPLAELPPLAFAFVLVLCRCTACVMLLPGWAETEIPAMLRIGFSLALTLLLLPSIAPLLPPIPEGVPRFVALVLAELLAGILLGFLARLVTIALPAGAQIFSAFIGLSSVLQPDAALGAQPTALSRLFGLAAPMLILTTGLWQAPLTALAGSYSVLGPGMAMPGGDLASSVTNAVSGWFLLAFRLAAPFLLAATVWHIALGLLSRLVPQLHVFAIAMPGQVLGGLVLVGLLAAALLHSWLGAAGEAFATLPGN